MFCFTSFATRRCRWYGASVVMKPCPSDSCTSSSGFFIFNCSAEKFPSNTYPRVNFHLHKPSGIHYWESDSILQVPPQPGCSKHFPVPILKSFTIRFEYDQVKHRRQTGTLRGNSLEVSRRSLL